MNTEPTKTQRLEILEGYRRCLDGSTFMSGTPPCSCNVCKRPAATLWGFEKEGCLDLFICDTCVLELELARRRRDNEQSVVD